MFCHSHDQSIHPLILEYIAFYGGEPVEVSPVGLANWALRSAHARYGDYLASLEATLGQTRYQAVLFIERDEPADGAPGRTRFRIEHPLTCSFNGAPGGTFCRFTLHQKPQAARQ